LEVSAPIECIRLFRIENRKPNRIFLVLACVINRCRRRRLTAADEDDLCEELFDRLLNRLRRSTEMCDA
jgi:hypothetical protein